MNRLHYSPEAVRDLAAIKVYISEELASPDAAERILEKITKRIRSLEQFSEIGSPLSAVIAIHTDYRILVCGNYLVFYRAEERQVYISRVLYGKRDYAAILFRDNN